MTRAIFTFDTTHHALWAEEIARSEGVAHEVIPAPPEANAKCNIAIEVLAADRPGFAAALENAALPYAIFGGAKSSGGEG